MTFVSIDTSSGAVRSAAAASTIRAASRRLLGGRQMTGGKGGNPFWGPYSGGKVLLEGLRFSQCGSGIAERGMSGGKGAKGGNSFSELYLGPQVFLEELRTQPIR